MRKRMLTGIVVALSMFTYGESVADEDEAAAPTTIEELESAIADIIAERDVPAIGIAV